MQQKGRITWQLTQATGIHILLEYQKKNFLIVTAVWQWDRLSQEVVNAPTLEAFKIKLDNHLSDLLWFGFLHWAGCWTPLTYSICRDGHESKNKPGGGSKIAGSLVHVGSSSSKPTNQNKLNQQTSNFWFGDLVLPIFSLPPLIPIACPLPHFLLSETPTRFCILLCHHYFGGGIDAFKESGYCLINWNCGTCAEPTHEQR